MLLGSTQTPYFNNMLDARTCEVAATQEQFNWGNWNNAWCLWLWVVVVVVVVMVVVEVSVPVDMTVYTTVARRLEIHKKSFSDLV